MMEKGLLDIMHDMMDDTNQLIDNWFNFKNKQPCVNENN